jgi:hypothetical protein
MWFPFDDFDEIYEAMITVEHDKTKAIYHYNPHYTNSYFQKPRTIFLAQGYRVKKDKFGYESVRGASYDYDDRIRQWFGSKADTAWDNSRKLGYETRSTNQIEAYLRELYEAPTLEVVHILAGVNLSNGYPYRVFGYIKEPKK